MKIETLKDSPNQGDEQKENPFSSSRQRRSVSEQNYLTNPPTCDTMELSTEVGNSSCITKISPGIKDPNRINIYINDKFFCSLDITQLADQKLKIGQKLTPTELTSLKRASDFGKLYIRALEYSLSRPHSAKEIRDYLYKKTQDRLVRTQNRKTNQYETIKKPGYDKSLIQPVFDRLAQKGHIDDTRFAKLWVENRHRTKGTSLRRLEQELTQKGISQDIISAALQDSPRDESSELQKIIAKKRPRYPDDQKLIAYLLRQGFPYDDILHQVKNTTN